MNRTALSIKMLQILNTRKIVSIKELAEYLETNPRNIPEFKKELETAGYYINSTSGKYGGYSLDKTRTLPAVRLTTEQYAIINKGMDYLQNRTEFLEKKEFSEMMGKILSSIILQDIEDSDNITIINRFPLAMEENELKNRYLSINKCIKSKQKIKIDYLSLKDEVSERIIHPYKVFMYNNTWYTIGWDERRNDIRYFKLNRMTSYEILNDTFKVLFTYKEKDYLDEFGMIKNGEYYHIELLFSKDYATMIRDRVYGKNQKCTDCKEGQLKLETDMQNKENIVAYVLSFGKNVIVLNPKWLKDRIMEECKEILCLEEKS